MPEGFFFFFFVNYKSWEKQIPGSGFFIIGTLMHKHKKLNINFPVIFNK